jgi:hypothetical protein
MYKINISLITVSLLIFNNFANRLKKVEGETRIRLQAETQFRGAKRGEGETESETQNTNPGAFLSKLSFK